VPKSAGVPEKKASCLVEDEEPPDVNDTCATEDDKPPSRNDLRTIKERYFSHISPEQWNDWKWQFQNRITSIDELTKFIPLSRIQQKRLNLVTTKYPVAITPYYLSLINPLDENDPIRKQAIPSFEEVAFAGIGFEDPLDERKESVLPGLVHRYPDRVLMVLTDVCPMLCRHCTRKREWKHGFWMRNHQEIDAIIEYIAKNEKIRDVILSGGDPLTLSTHKLEDVISRLRKIKHVEIIRIGTRFPVVLPQRIDDELCAMLSKYTPIWLNTHFNHPNEITDESAKACDRLVKAGVPVNNQSVLLKGVNDSVEIQKKLCHSLLKIKVRPYYLYQCDEIQGTEHLRTSVETGIKIMEGMWGHTSGLAIPTYVIDLPQGGGKVPVLPRYMMTNPGEDLVFRNYTGRYYRYRNPRNSHLSKKGKNGEITRNPIIPWNKIKAAAPVVSTGVKNENRSGI
jgi:lysine 2,3-aminomutase